MEHKRIQCKAHMLPITDTLEIVGGKWKLPILFSLIRAKGPMRFMDLQREIGVITPKMLSKELKDLEINQLVQRTVFPTTPVTVEYSMTEYGKTLGKVMRALEAWGTQHRARILDGIETPVVLDENDCPTILELQNQD